ncbi:HD domain-containing phosphohydrolase [Vibrio sp.]|uniref:HD domain-containing phosphohydrolase n=1 Tax=Vibrio sp. TaxID=678 RepID=UPI003D0DF475
MDNIADQLSLNLRSLFISVSRALDSVGVDDSYHGLRVGYISYRCAQQLGWTEEQAQLAFYAGIVHDCGVSHGQELTSLLGTLVPDDTYAHCYKGHQLLQACQPLASFAPAILHHHTWWQELKTNTTLSEYDKQLAALVLVADRTDYLLCNTERDAFGNFTLAKRREIAEKLTSCADGMLNPAMVSAIARQVDCDDFWFALVPRHIELIASQFNDVTFMMRKLKLDEIIQLAEFIAAIVDAKSPFTFHHSRHVALLSEFLAGELGYSDNAQRLLYLAGLLHDIGKLRTPEPVLHKPGKLTEQEYLCIKRHATDSRFALMHLFGNNKVVDWASSHHERLDGSGYPMGLTAEQLDQPSRIIAVADVFQAMTQSRPYRDGMSLEQALDTMAKMVQEQQLDVDVYRCLWANAEHCFQLSTQPQAVLDKLRA